MKKRLSLRLVMTPFIAVGVISCTVDEAYDIKHQDIDSDISLFTGGLSMPLGSTSKISFQDISDLEGLEDIEVSESVSFTDAVSDFVTKIPKIKDSRLTFEKTFTYNNLVPDETKSIALRFDFSDNITLISSSEIPPEIKVLNRVELSSGNFFSELIASGLPDIGNGYYNATVTVDIPDYFGIDDIRSEGRIIDGKFNISGNDVRWIDLSSFDLSKDISIPVKVSGTIEAVNPTITLDKLKSLNINIKIETCINNATISKAYGRFNYSISEVSEKVVFGSSLPKFLDKNNTVLDICNPVMTLDVMSNFGFPVKGTVEIIPVTNGKQDNSKKLKVDILLPATQDAKIKTYSYCIAGSASLCPEGAVFCKADVVNLIKDIPDEFDIIVNTSCDAAEQAVVDTKADYQLEAKYKVSIPLEFGKDFKIAASDTLDMKDIGKYLEAGSFGIKGTITNSLPLQIEMDLGLLDEQDGEIVLDQKVHQIIKSCTADHTPVDTDIDLTVNGNSKTSEAVKLTMKFNLCSGSSAGIKITNEDFIQAKDIVITFPQGISTDVL